MFLCIYILVYGYMCMHIQVYISSYKCTYVFVYTYDMCYYILFRMFGLISRMIFLSSFLFNLKIHRNYVLPTLLYAVILKYYLSQSSHFKVILSPRDTPQWFCGLLCLLFTSVYPWERIDTPVSKNNTRWCFEDDLCIEHFKK